MIELREKYLKVQENEKFVKGDLFKLGWCDELDTTLPTLLIVSGVFQYFHEGDILKFIWDVKNRFSNVELIFDATNKFGIRYTNFYVKRTGNSNAMMHFYVEDAVEFAKKVKSRLIEVRPFYTDARKILNGKVGLYTKISMMIADRQKNAMILHLKI